ncbi:YoaK family protein [soil metagenome]
MVRVWKRMMDAQVDRMHLALMLALTFSTGVIDAVGYLGLDKVFAGNMTGNVVILGMALVGAEGLPIIGPVLALVGFMIGAAIGGFFLRTSEPGWNRRTTGLFGVVGLIMTVLAVILFVTEDDLPRALALTITGFLGGAMGLQAATARFIGVKDVTTVVVTSTITGLAADSRLAGGDGKSSLKRATAVAAILAGGAAGAGLLQWHLGAGLILAAVITIVVALLGSIHTKRIPDQP